MTRTPVTSSMVKSVGHDGDALDVEFHNGKVYRYAGVSAEDHQALLGAASFGKHFGEHIRGKFEHTLLDAEDDGARE